VLAFAAAKLLSDPAHALLATVKVGAAPTGMAVVQQGAGLLVACSTRFSSSTAPQVVMLLNTQHALQGQPAIQGSIAAGVFPRELTLAGSTVLVTNYGSQSLTLIDTTRLPA
jgi:DNA-binding beta-propeller fold protein YncE